MGVDQVVEALPDAYTGDRAVYGPDGTFHTVHWEGPRPEWLPAEIAKAFHDKWGPAVAFPEPKGRAHRRAGRRPPQLSQGHTPPRPCSSSGIRENAASVRPPPIVTRLGSGLWWPYR